MMHGRLPWLEPHDLTDAQRGLYDRIVSGPRAVGPQSFQLTDGAGRLEGPFNALLLVPEIGIAVQEVGSALRYRGSLTGRMREIAILEVSYLRRTEFEWYAHERIGRTAGLSEAELAALGAGRPEESFDRSEILMRELVRSLVVRRGIDRPALENAEAMLGQPVVMELIALVGYYDLLALSLRVWETPLPEGAAAQFTPVSKASELAYDVAQTILAATLEHARTAKMAPLGVAILDARGALKSYGAQEGVGLGRAPIALAKASGSLAMGFGSRSIAKLARDMPAFYTSLTAVVPGGLVPVPGGVLIRNDDGAVIGAVGVSGDVGDNDEAAAVAGINAANLRADSGGE